MPEHLADETFRAKVTLAADPATGLEAATKQYVDGRPTSTEVFAQTGAPSAGAAAIIWVDTDDTSVAGSVADVAWLRWTGTQAEYTALGTYDPNTLYVVVG